MRVMRPDFLPKERKIHFKILVCTTCMLKCFHFRFHLWFTYISHVDMMKLFLMPGEEEEDDVSSWEGKKRLMELLLKQYPEDIIDFSSDDDDEDEPSAKKSRNGSPREDYWNSVWGRMLLNPAIEDPESFVAKKFRRRFRVPYPLFKDVILPQCIEHNIFDVRRKSSIPIEIKIMISLRVLGRDAVADSCAELSSVKESTCNYLFKKFVVNYSRVFYDNYVYFPKGSELLDIMEVYRRLGFPGCVGSIDCTHIKWAACNTDNKWKATGKEGFPTLSFEAIVSHDRRCLHISVAFLESYNDITISKNDECVRKIVAGSLADVEYILYDEDGVPHVCTGAYMLSDNGYLNQSVFMCPWKTPSSRQQLLWSEWVESVRKDVECFFGLMKARWWFLRNGVRYHTAEIIQCAFRCAGIFHNMLLAYDGFLANGRTAWENLNPDEGDVDAFFQGDEEVLEETDDEDISDMPVMRAEEVVVMHQLQSIKHRFNKGRSYIPRKDFDLLRHALVSHFSHQYGIGDLWWPRSMNKKKRKCMGIPPINLRVLSASRAALYHSPSSLRARDRNRQTYTSTIGHGLFSSIAYKAGDPICVFSGDIISTVEQRRRTEAGRGGYMLYLNRLQCLDCYEHYLKGNCLASYANSTRHVRYNNDPGRVVVSNATLKVCTKNKSFTLYAKTYITQFTEILWSYEHAYVYPIPEH